jgi:phosphate-selective porin OprO and OprP
MRTRTLLGLAVAASLSNSVLADITVDVIGETEITFEALIQADGNYFSNNYKSTTGATLTPAQVTAAKLIDNSGMRRSELILKGKQGINDWSIGYDSRANKWLDVFYRHKLGGYTTIRAGQFKQPNSLEELTSTKHNDFISKALITNALGIARREGLEFVTGADEWTLTGTAFNREFTNNLARGNGYGLRGTFAPIYTSELNKEEQHTLHFGLSYVQVDAYKNQYRLNPRPEADLANLRLVDSGSGITDAENYGTLGLEGAYLNGPLKIAAEYMQSNVKRKTHGDFKADGWYVSGIYNLTGEKFTYKSGIYNTPIPDNPAGMWQVGLRYSTIDANDAAVLGGNEKNWTLGANWYWRQNFKLMANYVKVKSTKGVIDNSPKILEFRGQIMF